jgi:hypothetical protein
MRACVPFVLQLNVCVSVCVCVCVSSQVPAHTDRSNDERVLSKTTRFQDRGYCALFVVVTPTCITVGW